MIEFMYINPAMRNPKTGENVRTAETEKLNALAEANKKIIGLEMTVPELAALCDRNIDPQHSDGNADECCAKVMAEKAQSLLHGLLGEDVVFVTNRVDVDSVAAFVLAKRFLAGRPVCYNVNVAEINRHDTHAGAMWECAKPIEEAFDPEDKTGALASSIKVFTVTAKNIADVENFIDNGAVDEEIMNTYRQTRQNVIDKVKSGEIKTDVKGGVASVETTLPCATAVGYSLAPAVIAVNPAMRGADGTYRKVSICQHEEGYVDLDAVADSLNKLESGWGGSPTFKGSKQGESSTLGLEVIKTEVYKNLTESYKRELFSDDNFLTGNVDLTMFDEVDLRGRDLNNVKSLKFKAGATVDLTKVTGVPKDLDVSTADEVNLNYCDLSNVDGLKFNEGAVVSLCSTKGLKGTIDFSLCSEVIMSDNDLSSVSEVKFANSKQWDYWHQIGGCSLGAGFKGKVTYTDEKSRGHWDILSVWDKMTYGRG